MSSFLRLNHFLLCISILTAIGCDTKNNISTNSTAAQDYPLSRAFTAYLSEDYAMLRKAQISDVSYDLEISLLDEVLIKGTSKISFTYSAVNKAPVTIDFDEGIILSSQLNGIEFDSGYEKWFITIPYEQLVEGENILTIGYERPYANNSRGLHQYVDPNTNNRYVYTNFEPYSANKLFPHFDQPNIKATYTLQVMAPESWNVISSTKESKVEKHGNYAHWYFPESAKYSSYLFPLHAGPYAVWEKPGDIPMRVFARQELADQVKPEMWFEVTSQLLEFFENYYEIPYPYLKYDQILVPEYNSGAMENIAAVTFNEIFLRKGDRTEREKLGIAYIIAHEMAHMWFGNLVTMDWWNGLWLNESFATYLAMLAVNEATDIEGVWDTFYTRGKSNAYYADQLPTTHPIELPIPTTNDAFANFDSITYGKGASVLKQLPYYIGEENFKKGIVSFLKKYRTSNTTLNDFVQALEESSGEELGSWMTSWLETAGLNRIQLDLTCDNSNSKLKTLTVVQTAPDNYPTLRSQKINIALFNKDTEGKMVRSTISTIFDGSETNVTLKDALPCPDLAYPNADDMAYAKVLLDGVSREYIQQGIHSIKDNLIRTMLWDSMWDLASDQKITLKNYVDFVVQNFAAETDLTSINRISTNLIHTYELATQIEAVSNSDEKALFANIRKSIEFLFFTQLLEAKGGTDLQEHLFSNLIKAAHTDDVLDFLANTLQETSTLPGLDLDQHYRWDIVVKLQSFGEDNIPLVQAEKEVDTSKYGRVMAVVSEVVVPAEKNKLVWLEKIADKESTHNTYEKGAIVRNLFPSHQLPIHNSLIDKIIDITLEASAGSDLYFSDTITDLFSGLCDKEGISKVQKLIPQIDAQHVSLIKQLRIAAYEGQKCIDFRNTQIFAI